ncbi:hypothetical protein DCM91_18630 [Chitinophaga costaii]|nr:hypothetical protein DCM91_18630 [Chitinophaga costaii]
MAASDTLALDLSAPPAQLDLRPYIFSFDDAGYTLVSSKLPLELFIKNPRIFHPDTLYNNHTHNVWMYLRIRNTASVTGHVTVFAGWHDQMEWYAQDGINPPQHLMTTGFMVDNSKDRWHHYGFLAEVPGGATRTFYLRILNRNLAEHALMPVAFNDLTLAHFEQNKQVFYQHQAVFILVLLGMLLIFLITAIINYIQLPDRSYLYFAAYILGLIFYFALRLDNKPYQLSWFYPWPSLKYYWDVPALLFCFYFMYLLFGNAFLNLRERFPFLERVFKVVSFLIVCITLVCVGFIAQGFYHISYRLYGYVFLASLLPSISVFIILTRRSKHHPLIRFFVFGAVSLNASSLYAFTTHLGENGFYSGTAQLTTPSYIIVVGMLLQAMFFLAGLSYRNKLVHQERTKTQEMLIKQLNKNKELQRKLNEQLEELVKEQTTEILRKKQELEEQRKIQSDFEYGKKLAEIELKAIRAQINPHFIFNCLNSIQLFVMQRDFELAQKYLSDFSYLIRKTLDFSRRNFIALTDEITYLNTYLGLEKMRFEHKMEFEIQVDPDLAIAELEVPSMLLQPYVENAVKHGMNNSFQPIGHLMISFRQTAADVLECTIEDNGIGIEKTKALRTLPKSHQSSGMEISFNRAELLNKMFNTGIQIEIIDKATQDQQHSGTMVRVLIPQL